jgi:hypothetical protein
LKQKTKKNHFSQESLNKRKNYVKVKQKQLITIWKENLFRSKDQMQQSFKSKKQFFPESKTK